MSELSVSASGFPISHSAINGTRRLNVSKRRCLKFAQTIGLPLMRAASPSAGHAVALAAYKALAIKCAIDFTGASLFRPRAYERMDQSEKANISYWTGMTFAALIADEFLNVSRLVHATALQKSRLARVDPDSRRLADLVGQDGSGAWHVVEAKARQDKQSFETLAKWKEQAQTVATIDGVAPATRSYSFTRVGRTYSAVLVDPPPDPRQSDIHINFNEQALVKGYYGPLVEWLSSGAITIERADYRLYVHLAAFDPVDNEFIFFGLTEEMFHAARELWLPRPSEVDRETDDAYIGTDGIVVVTSESREIE